MTKCRHGLSEDCPACMQATIDALVKALRYMVDNPSAHPANMVAVARDALADVSRSGESS